MDLFGALLLPASRIGSPFPFPKMPPKRRLGGPLPPLHSTFQGSVTLSPPSLPQSKERKKNAELELSLQEQHMKVLERQVPCRPRCAPHPHVTTRAQVGHRLGGLGDGGWVGGVAADREKGAAMGAYEVMQP